MQVGYYKMRIGNKDFGRKILYLKSVYGISEKEIISALKQEIEGQRLKGITRKAHSKGVQQ